MDKLIELLQNSGVHATVAEEGTAPEGGVSVPLADGRALVLRDSSDAMRALAALAENITGGAFGACSARISAMRRVLFGSYDENDPASQIEERDPSCPRCVMVFQSRDDLAPLERALAELFPVGGGDDVVDMENGRIAVVKQMRDAQWNDAVDLCLAILDTVGSESGMRIAVGIGDVKENIRHLSTSYNEAVEAMRTGARFHPAHNVHVYRSLIIERFLREVPTRTLREYHGQLFGPHNEKLLNGEMRQTVDKFFECNLNLSEAARQLYIHRNTLVYRLDKFERAVGLDLRRFDDAVIYKLLYMMGKGEPVSTF